jgi:hypothetical protein
MNVKVFVIGSKGWPNLPSEASPHEKTLPWSSTAKVWFFPALIYIILHFRKIVRIVGGMRVGWTFPKPTLPCISNPKVRI